MARDTCSCRGLYLPPNQVGADVTTPVPRPECTNLTIGTYKARRHVDDDESRLVATAEVTKAGGVTGSNYGYLKNPTSTTAIALLMPMI